jgi:lipoprotein-anchoring transpeptidase ErfK/SrfK
MELIVLIAASKLCAAEVCYPVTLNKTKTIPGTYQVESIYLNATMKTAQGLLPPGSFGGIIIDLEETDIAIHSGKATLPGVESSGCVRMHDDDIKQLISDYYFNRVIIK